MSLLIVLLSSIMAWLLHKKSKLGYLIFLVLLAYSLTSSTLISKLLSGGYVLQLETNLNQSYLYDSPLSSLPVDLNRVAYNKPHYLLRVGFEHIVEIFDFERLIFSEGKVFFFWQIPLAVLGAVLLSKRGLSIFSFSLVLCLIKGVEGIVFIFPWVVYLDAKALVYIYKKYVK